MADVGLLTEGALAEAANGRFHRALRDYGLSLDNLPSTVTIEDWRAVVWQFFYAGFLSGSRYGFRASAEFADVPQTLAAIITRAERVRELMTDD